MAELTGSESSTASGSDAEEGNLCLAASGTIHGSARVRGFYGPVPKWRGILHLGAFIAAIPLGVWLFISADKPWARPGVIVYVISLAGLFGTSASYHRLATSRSAVTWMRRLDHSMIFVLIAGSYTPLCLVVLPRNWGIPVLIVVWLAALAGIIFKMMSVDDERSSGSWLYIVQGWIAVVVLPLLWTRLGLVKFLLLAVGGVVYTAGAVVLATRRPNPSPHCFGYHEIFHAATIVAAGCHFALIAAAVSA